MAVASAHGGMSSRLAAWAGLWCPASGRRSDCRIVRRGRARQKRKRACPARRGGMTACGQSDNPSPSQKQRVVRSSWSVQLGWQHRWCGHSGLIVVLPSSPLRRTGGDGPVATGRWRRTGGDGPVATDRWRRTGGALWVVAAHARRYLDVNGGRTRIHGAAGGVERDLAEFEQKGNIISAWRWKFIVFQ